MPFTRTKQVSSRISSTGGSLPRGSGLFWPGDFADSSSRGCFSRFCGFFLMAAKAGTSTLLIGLHAWPKQALFLEVLQGFQRAFLHFQGKLSKAILADGILMMPARQLDQADACSLAATIAVSQRDIVDLHALTFPLLAGTGSWISRNHRTGPVPEAIADG